MLSRILPILLIQQAFAQDLGENCRLSGGKNGVCKAIADCPSAISSLQRRVEPERCGFQGNDPIVCCENLFKNSPTGAKSKQYCNDTYISSNNGLLPGSFPILAVTHGVNSLAKEFPHMAALGFGEESEKVWACGGSLISKEFVLTAAHCLKTSLGDVSYVRLGDLNIKKTDDDAQPQDFKVLRTFRHPDYKPPSQYHDIALLQLDRPVEITPYVKPACVNTETQISDGVLTATGWGKIEFGGESSDHLQKVEIDLVSNSLCRKAYANIHARRLANGIVDGLQICAGRGNRDTCQGDSGGPLQMKNIYYFEGHTIYGVTSIGKACGLSNSPGVYTRVSKYIDWIESIVWP